MNLLRLFPSRNLAVLFIDFVLLSTVYTAVTLFVYGLEAQVFLFAEMGWFSVLVAVASVIFALYFDDLYGDVRVASRVGLALQFCHAFGIALIVQTLVKYLGGGMALPRLVVLLGAAASFPILYGWRLLYSDVVWKLLGQQSVLIVGDGLLAQDVAAGMRYRPERGFRPAGYLGAENPAFAGETCLGRMDQLDEVAQQIKPDRIVVALADQDDRLPLRQLLEIRRRGLTIEDGPVMFERMYGRVSSRDFRPARFIFDQTIVHRPGSVALQSVYINLLGLAGLIITSPFLILLAIIVRVSMRGSVLDPVACVGYHGIHFSLLRFRTSMTSADGTAAIVTPLGRFLRRTYLERLPTLINLVRGELALVGPRPDRPEFSRELADRLPFYDQRYAVKPGLTGWSQINLDNGPSQNDALLALEYDLYYLKHISLALDAYILVHRLRNIASIS